MRAEIISVGTELLLGDILNTNAQYLSQEMAALGFSVFYQTVVGDNPARLEETVKTALARSDVLLFTGGLGPTDDDLTKQTVAGAFGDELVLDEEELARIQSFFKSRGMPMTPNNAKQAMVPGRGRKLQNPNGTAPGAMFKKEDKLAFLMPGPPGEMRPMFDKQVRPALLALQDAALHSLVLRVFGMGESVLEDHVHPLLEGSNPTAALYAKTGEVHVRITARAKTDEEAAAMCEEHAREFRAVLGPLIYSETNENLETTVVQLLAKEGAQVATAESCTGGLLSQRITSVEGASKVFGFGLCSYSNNIKERVLGVPAQTLQQFGAVSPQVAIAMAKGAAACGSATYGVGITGVAGPGGGTPQKPVGLVYVAALRGTRLAVKELHFGGRGRKTVRWMAAQTALDMLRRLALGVEIEDALPDFAQ